MHDDGTITQKSILRRALEDLFGMFAKPSKAR